MKIFSTFSGIGGFEIGIEAAYSRLARERERNSGTSGRQETLNSERTRLSQDNGNINDSENERSEDYPVTVGYSEIDKYAIKVYEKQFPGVQSYGDITKINAKELPDFDCLVGGFPCQAFSIAGKRRGFDDTRGTLFFDLARILREKQPRYFVFENVKGLLSHDQGNTFRTIIATIDELGYDCQWSVLNSKDFGVPQNRERVYIVGHLRGTPRPEVFPIAGADFTNTIKKLGNVNPSGRGMNGNVISSEGLSSTLSTNKGEGIKVADIRQLNQPKHSNDRVYASDGISPTLNTMQGGNRQPFVAEDVRIRRLTPRECEALQGFPQDWTAEGVDGAISDTQRYKMCGNAVTVNVVQAVFEKLLQIK